MPMSLSLHSVFKLIKTFYGYLMTFYGYLTKGTKENRKKNLVRTLQKLHHSIDNGDNKKKIKKVIDHFYQNLAENKQLLSELYTSGIKCTTQTDLILAACQNNQADTLYYLLKETDFLVYLTDDSFDDVEVNKQRTEAIKHALILEDFNMVEMLYDFWCGNLHWSGHVINNINMVGEVLRNTYVLKDKQLQGNVHCLITFNDFQREIYTELARLNNNRDPKETATMILKVLSIYDKYSRIENIRRKHAVEEREQAIKDKIADNSSTFYRNLEYLYHEVYFRKMDFNVALLILENLYVIRKELKTRFNKTTKYFADNPNEHKLYDNAAKTYKGIESEIYHFIYCTSEDWWLYLPQNRWISIEEHTVINRGRKNKIKLTLDLQKVYAGPVIFLERESFIENLEKLKIILKEHVIPKNPAIVCTQNNQNRNSKLVYLLNDNYLQTVSYMTDHYSLIKIVYYIEAIEETENVIMIERVLQVVGEMLKSSDDSHHLSQSSQALLRTAISVEAISHLQGIRKFLSHARDGQLSARIKMANTQAQRFEEIKEELIEIKNIINPILNVFESILHKSLLEKGFRLLEKRIDDLPDEAKQRVDEIYRLYKIHKSNVVLESGDYYQKDWRHTGLSVQLLEEIPWLMQNKAKIYKEIKLAKRRIVDNIVSILPSIIPYVRKILAFIIENKNNVNTLNQEISKYNNRVCLLEYPDTKEINEIKMKVTKMMKTKNFKINLGLLNKIKNSKDHWESVKGMLSFCLTECNLIASIKNSISSTPTVTEACNILRDLEVVCVTYESTLPIGPRIYRKLKTWKSLIFNQKHFRALERLHTDFKNIKSGDPSLARDELISSLIMRLNLLKQTLLYPARIPLSQLVRRFDHDVQFRIIIEMVLADIANVLADCNIRLMAKSSNLLRDIDLGNVLDHGNPFLEVIGDILNSHDLAAEWLDKAMMFAEDAESIEALNELFKSTLDYQTFSSGDLLKMNDKQKRLYKQFVKSPNWISYAPLRYPIRRSSRQNIQP